MGKKSTSNKPTRPPSPPEPTNVEGDPSAHLFRLFSCTGYGCGARWWVTDGEPNPGHKCKAKKSNPLMVTFLAQSREIHVPDTQPVVPLPAGARKHGTDGV